MWLRSPSLTLCEWAGWWVCLTGGVDPGAVEGPERADGAPQHRRLLQVLRTGELEYSNVQIEQSEDQNVQ